MPLITEYRAVKDVYQQATELGAALPVFCAEDRETLEAILASALELGREIGVEDLPIVPAWTCRYPPRAQMKLLTACGDPVLGTHLMFADLQAFTGPDGPYRRLRVLPHLDHAFPWLDGDVLLDFADRFASVMCDASERPFDENVRLTARYVEQVKGRVVVEGAVDEIYSAASQQQQNAPTSVAQAARFLKETGVDLLVPNVGTEHRATSEQAHYLPERAREISAATGKILCLHGTSSLQHSELGRLPGDGFVKINIFTTLAVHGGQAVARCVLNNVGNIFDAGQLQGLVREGLLGDRALGPDFAETKPPIKPKLDRVANPPRRDAWFSAVRARCKEYLRALNYERFAS
ncbi:MAG: class II fructose-bisphosphate aldolase [Planctomycetota bacterium]|nr:class II fructose-bisphosphate aldolase [Planctomycetota bacterium]